MRIDIFLLLALLGISGVTPAASHAQDTPSDTFRKPCRYTDSPNYRPNQAVTVRDGQLLLVHSEDGAILATLDNGFESYFDFNIFWTENCRYIIALNIWRLTDRYPYPIRVSTMYDTFTGREIMRWQREEFLQFRYSPSKAQFIMRRTDGAYLMTERLAEPVLLQSRTLPTLRALRQFRWDMAREQLIAVFWSNTAYVQVFDLWTGALHAVISQPEGCSQPINFGFSADERYLLAYSRAGHPHTSACITVVDRDSGAQISVPTGEITAATREAIALSTDGRYLALGWNGLRVWDLSALPAEFAAREPVYRHEGPLSAIRAVRFIDSTTVEIGSEEGVGRWDLLTGASLP